MNISPEVQGVLIGSAITTVLALVTYYIKSHKGNFVIVQKIRETSLIYIQEQVRKKLSIIYDQRQIEKLKLYEFVISNKGDSDIEDFEIKMNVIEKPETRVMELQVNDPQAKTEIVNHLGDSGFISIKRPFLNPQKKIKSDVITIQVFTDTELEFSFTGGGRGWGVAYKEDTGNKKSHSFLTIITIIIVAITFGFIPKTDSWELNILFSLICIDLLLHNRLVNEYRKTLNR